MAKLCKIYHRHFEWMAFTTGLVLLVLMDPFTTAHNTLCLFEQLGWYCPGEGLGRSISLIFRGYFRDAWHLQPAGYLALAVLIPHTGELIYKRFTPPNSI